MSKFGDGNMNSREKFIAREFIIIGVILGLLTGYCLPH